MNNILICVPAMNMVATEFFASFTGLRRVEGSHVLLTRDTLIYSARNSLALTAVERGYRYLMWIDSDMILPPDTLEKLYAEAEEKNLDAVSGLYFKRTSPTEPVILKKIDWRVNAEGTVEREAEPYLDYPKDALFEVEGAGTGCLLTRVDIYRKVMDRFGITPFQPLPQLGEDYSFAWRLKQLGIKMHCDSRIKLGHAGAWIYDEAMYLSQREDTTNHA